MRYYVKDRFFTHAVDLLYNSSGKYWYAEYVGMRKVMPQAEDVKGPIKLSDTNGLHPHYKDIFHEIAGCIPMHYVAEHLPQGSNSTGRVRSILRRNESTLGRLSSLYGLDVDRLSHRYDGMGEGSACAMKNMEQRYLDLIELYMHKEAQFG